MKETSCGPMAKGSDLEVVDPGQAAQRFSTTSDSLTHTHSLGAAGSLSKSPHLKHPYVFRVIEVETRACTHCWKELPNPPLSLFLYRMFINRWPDLISHVTTTENIENTFHSL